MLKNKIRSLLGRFNETLKIETNNYRVDFAAVRSAPGSAQAAHRPRLRPIPPWRTVATCAINLLNHFRMDFYNLM